jgi:hypothetical protein
MTNENGRDERLGIRMFAIRHLWKLGSTSLLCAGLLTPH